MNAFLLIIPIIFMRYGLLHIINKEALKRAGLYAVSIINYAKPKMNGINLNGLYKVSRNPIYLAYFIYLLGCVALTQSWILLVLLICFQISAHWIILSEERWCIKKFGAEYIKYMNRVRRYI